MKPSGIGGQAVIEGIMMRNKDQYSIAVRKPDNEIEVTVRDCNQLQKKHPWLNYPIIRGVYSFVVIAHAANAKIPRYFPSCARRF